MPAKSGAPENGTYQHVFQRLKKDPRLEWRFVGYTENVLSRDVEHRGRRLPTFFCNDDATAGRMHKTGYVNITDQWFEDHPEARTGKPEAKAPAKSKTARARGTVTEPYKAKGRSKARARG